MKLQKQNIVKLFMILGMLSFSYSYSIAQTTDEVEDFEESYEGNETRFFDDINETRFKSNFNDIEESRRIDYSSGSNRQSREFNVFGKENEFSDYQFKVENENSVQGNGSNNITISSGGTWEQVPPTTGQTPNSNSPSVGNPFGTNPGVRSPRNMDAVPDNGDDPNDVPLDGGILVLGLAAAAYGFRKKFNN